MASLRKATAITSCYLCLTTYTVAVKYSPFQNGLHLLEKKREKLWSLDKSTIWVSRRFKYRIAQRKVFEELHSIKSLRQQCEELNRAFPVDTKRHKPFVIISGKIMKRNAYGKLLKFYTPSEANKLETSDLPAASQQVKTNKVSTL